MNKKILIITLILFSVPVCSLFAQYTGGEGSGYDRDTTYHDIPLGDIHDTDLVVADIVTPLDGGCGAVDQMFDVALFNAGAYDLDSIPLFLIVEGDVSDTAFVAHESTISSRSDDTIQAGPIDLSDGGMVNVTVYNAHPYDMARYNDTVSKSFQVNPIPEIVTHNDTLCERGDYVLVATGNADEYEWYTNPHGDVRMATNDSLVIEDQQSSVTFYAEGVFDDTGCRSKRKPANGVFVEGPDTGDILVKSSAPQGSQHDGTLNDPDLVCAESPVTYEITPPYSMTQQDFGIKWDIDNVTIENQNGVEPEDYTFNSPDTTNKGTIQIKPGIDQGEDLFEIDIEFININSGCKHNYYHYLEVKQTPDASFTFQKETCEDDAVSLENNSSFDGDGTLEFSWTLHTESDTDTVINTTSTDPINRLFSAGEHNITLKATEPEGCHSDTTATLTSHPTPGVFFEIPEEICHGDTINPENMTIDDDAIDSYFWGFGDGQTSQDFEPYHVYSDTGTFTISLDAYTVNGCMNENEKDIKVRPIPVPQIAHEGNCLDEVFDFELIDTSGIQSGTWHIEDSLYEGKETFYKFSETGEKEVQFAFESVHGCVDTAKTIVSVHELPVSQFSYDKTDPFVSFTADKQGVTEYNWDFGDGNQSNETNPEHEYTENGNFTASLQTVNEEGCTDSSSKTIEIVATFLGEKETKASSYEIYPNPASNFISVIRDAGQSPVENVRLIDIAGKAIINHETDAQNYKYEILLHEIETGIYWLSFTNSDGQTFNKKIKIVQ